MGSAHPDLQRINAYLLLKIVAQPVWWLVLFLIPLVNVVIGVILCIDLAKAFGKSALFGIVFLLLLCPIGVLILRFGSATYQRPART